MTTDFRESTAQLLRPHQVEEYRQDVSRIEGELSGPAWISAQVQDRAAKLKQLKQLKHDLETQAPQPYRRDELDRAKKRHDELVETITTGMPTQAEMRRRPAGAVEKHMAWEKRAKHAVLEWKNIRLRFQAGGQLDGGEAGEIANVERLRPHGGPGELNMDGTLIEGKNFHLPPAGAALPTTFTDRQVDLLRELDPDLAARLAALGNEQRAELRALLDDIERPPAARKMAPKRRAKSQNTQSGRGEVNTLRQRCKALGLNSWGKSRLEMQEMLADAEAQSVAPEAAE